MNWDDLRHVLAISRSRTLTRAAAELGVTHTTVGRRLAAMESQLSVRLFHRTPDGLFATPAGQELVEVAERVEGDVHAAERSLMGRDAELRGALRVSVLDYLLWAFSDAFASFCRRYPSVEVTLTATAEQVSLTRREADVALRLTDNPPDLLIGRRVTDIGFAVYAHESLGIRPSYADYPWIGWDERLDARWLEDWLGVHAPGAKVVMRIDENAILRRQVICAGIGAFLLPCLEGDRVPGLRRLGPVEFSRPLWLLTLPELRHTSRVRAFLDHMAASLPGCVS